MYKLLIVDDEYLVLEGLRKLVDWKKYNMQIVGEAASGQEGIRLAAEVKPDVIITDIKMPDLSGLDMMKRILDANPRIRFLVFSGHDDFNWAKRAFQYGAIDYLLKPIDLEQLDAVLQKAVEKIEEERSREKLKEDSARTLNRSLRLMKREALLELLNGSYASEEAIKEKLEAAELKMGEEPCVVMVLRFKDSPGQPLDIKKKKELAGLVLQFLEEGGWGSGVAVSDEDVALIVTAPGVNVRWCVLLAENICHRYGLKEMGAVIGIGGEYDRLNRIKFSFIEAQQAASYQYLSGTASVCYSDVQDKLMKLEKVNYPQQLVETVMEGLKTANSELVKKTLEEYIAQVQQKKVEISYFRSSMMELLFVLRKELKGMNVDLSKVFIDEFEEINCIQSRQSLEDVWKDVSRFIWKVMSFIEVTSSKSNKQIVKEVMRIMDDSFTQSDLTLNDVAEKVFLTPNYVSMLIKKETGQNFSDIILKKRIEKAKDLLFDETLKTYEISEKVGYVDQNYFYKAFKKVVGMTPGEFRNKFCG